MKGLLKNNYFAVRSNAKAFSVFMLLLGIFVVAVISPSLLMGYAGAYRPTADRKSAEISL